MRPYTTAADEKFRTRVSGFCRAALNPTRQLESDVDAIAVVREMGEAGLIRAAIPAAEGGLHDHVRSLSVVVAREEIATASAFADTMFAMQGLGSFPITLAGSVAQRRHYLPKVARGEYLAAFALTEADAGSDAAAIATTAESDGRDYRLNGSKRFISNAGVAHFYVVFAKTDPDAGAKGVSAFVVDADHPGLEVVERMTLNAPHPIGVIRFRDVRVKRGARLGQAGDGLKLALSTLDCFRPTVGAAACGIGRRALTETLARVRSRHQFGRPISAFQMTRARIAEMATRLEAARGLVYRAAWARDRGEPPTLGAAMAKLAATEAAFQVVDDAVQLHGGDGVVVGTVVERLYREVRALRLYEGTSEIQKLVIAKQLIDGDR